MFNQSFHEGLAQENAPVSEQLGIEIGQFRLKDGVSEAEMLKVYKTMVDAYLSKLSGWENQHLIKTEDDIYMDMAVSESMLKAREICSSWAGNDYCAAFLNLIEPVDMSFGSLIV